MPYGLRSPFAKLKAAPDNPVERPDGLRLFGLHDLGRERRDANEQIIRGACKVAYLGQNTALCRVLGRYKAYVDTTDIGLSSHLMLDGYWEMWVTEVLYDLIRPGMVVADIGANVGYYSLLMADLVGPTGRVHAFEPNPRLSEFVGKSLLVNGFSRWATVHQMALGDQDDRTVALAVPPSMPMNAFILPAATDVPSGCTEVPMARLDSRDDWRDIELAKVDVEGAEELVWSGTRGLLEGSKLRTVVLEITLDRYGDPAAFVERLCADGFALHRLTLDEGVVPTDMDFILSQAETEDIMLVLKR